MMRVPPWCPAPSSQENKEVKNRVKELERLMDAAGGTHRLVELEVRQAGRALHLLLL